ncbi:unnamed protein product [Protopolystoma xenopodis]|uniref:Uncharacterized protein n=1 Tax=Protopolystoma xenopodis TaxID=117903 RepID=A0A448XD83_9PLAT|nr:unnamed protein product [Protopolystoma xenopodis]
MEEEDTEKLFEPNPFSFIFGVGQEEATVGRDSNVNLRPKTETLTIRSDWPHGRFLSPLSTPFPPPSEKRRSRSCLVKSQRRMHPLPQDPQQKHQVQTSGQPASAIPTHLPPPTSRLQTRSVAASLSACM